MSKEEFTDAIRAAVLAALDECAARFGVHGRTPGATDADLPALFEVLDKQADKLIERRENQAMEEFVARGLSILTGSPTWQTLRKK